MAVTSKLGTAELLFQRAQQMGLNPNWITPNGLFAISVDQDEKYINFARSPLNSHTSVSLAKDKYLTRLILERHGLPNIPFCRPESEIQAIEFLNSYKKIIVKPLRGFGARDIHVVTNPTQLKNLDINKYILEQYIEGKELRYLVLDEAVIGVHHSEYGNSVEEDRELQRISYSTEAWDPKLVALSVQIANILDLKFAAVDFLIGTDGRSHILEVNSTPGLKWFHAPSSGPVIDVARFFLESILQKQNPESAQSLGIQALTTYS